VWFSNCNRSSFWFEKNENIRKDKLSFILTDGLYQENEYKRILRAVSNCVKSGLNVFGIGIRIYPVRIENLFLKVIYCHNPYNLNKAIANFFGDQFLDLKIQWYLCIEKKLIIV
jgi:hypothetical protein